MLNKHFAQDETTENQMKKLLLFLSILSFLTSCNGQDNPKINSEPIPEKYEAYVPVDENKIVFGDYEMSLKFKSYEPIELIHLNTNELLVKTKSKEKLSELSIINADGEIVRKYKHLDTYENGEEKLIKAYLVNFEKKYFKTWALDEKEDEKEIIQENAHLDYANDKITEQIEAIFKTADFIKIDYDYDYQYIGQKKDTNKDDEKPKAIYFKPTVYIINYLKHNTWHQLYTLIDVSRRISLDELLSSESNSLFEKYNATNKKWEVIPNENITYQYFHKIKTKRIIHPIGGGQPAYQADWWLGNLYLNVKIDKDTLKIYDKLYLDEEWFQTPIRINGKEIGTFQDINEEPIKPFMLYSNQNLNFHLFTNDKKKLFFIQKKKY